MRGFLHCCVVVTGSCAILGVQASESPAENRRSELTFRTVVQANVQHDTQPPTPPAQAFPVTQATAVMEDAMPVMAPPQTFEPTVREDARPAAPRVAPAAPLRASQAIFAGRTAPAQVPRRMQIQPAPQRITQRPVKPFEALQPSSTLSPYLHLDRSEDDREGVPNYFTFVRPQFEQQEANRAHQEAMQQLRGQLQNMPSAAGTGVRARYMDTAQFYSRRAR